MGDALRSTVALVALVAMSGTAFGAAVCELLCVPTAEMAHGAAPETAHETHAASHHARGHHARGDHAQRDTRSSTDSVGSSCHRSDDEAVVVTEGSRGHACGEHADRFVASRVAELKRAGWLVLPALSVLPTVHPPMIQMGAPNAPRPNDGTDIPPPEQHFVLLI